jgi:hypothetical protein
MEAENVAQRNFILLSVVVAAALAGTQSSVAIVGR